MKQQLLKSLRLRVTMLVAMLCGLLGGASTAWGEEVTDEITAAQLEATGTTYTAFSNVSVTSSAVYAGQSAKTSNGGIQLRSKNSNSGIVSTTSGGKLKSVTITVESGTNTVDIYGSNTAYTGAGDLYSSSTQGTKIGSLSQTGTVTVEGDYTYVGIRSNNGAIYLTNVTIVWETGGSTPSTPSINASDINIAYDATSGSIAYTIDNPTSETIAATENSDWLTLGTVGASPISFTCTANPGKTARTATVTLTYGTVTKSVTVTQAGNPNVLDNISDINAAGTYSVRGTIVAKSQRGFIVGDGTGYVYYYNKDYTQTEYNIGDKVQLSGSVVAFGGVFEFNNSTTITEATESNYVAEEPTVLTGAQMDTRVGSTTPAQLSSYVQYEGVLSVSVTDNGTFYNITNIDGASTAKGSISYPLTTDFASLNGKLVKVTGYYVGVSSSQYYNTMIGSIEEVVSTTPIINLTSAAEMELAYNATSGEITYSIVNPTEGKSLTATSSADWISNITVNAGTVTFATTANEGTANRTATITLAYEGAESVPVTVTQKYLVADYATLPFEFNGGKSTIATTAGLSQSGLGDDYNSAPQLKFDSTGDEVVLKFNERPGKLTFTIKGNGFSSGSTSTFKVQVSADGTTYTDVKTYTELNTLNETIEDLSENVRYIKWIYTEKGATNGGNVALGNIKLAKYVAPVSSTLTVPTVDNVNITASYNTDEILNEGESAEIEQNTVIILTVDAAEGYTVKSVTVTGPDGQSLTPTAVPDSEGAYRFTMPAYNATISVTVEEYVAPQTATYVLASEIVSGKHYVIANGTADGSVKVMGDQNTNNRGAVDATITDGKLSVSDAYEFVIKSATIDEASGYSIYDAGDNGYLYAASSSSNLLKTQDENNANGIWAITIGEGGKASIVAQGANTRKVMQFNPNESNNNPLFACYSSASQSPVYLFVKEEAEEPTTVKLNSNGYATYASTKALDFSDAEADGYTAWQVTGISGNDITFEQITGAVAAGTGLLLKGEAGDEITMTFAQTTGSDISATNKLVGITEATTVEANTYYGLKGEQFLKVKAGTVPAGKALLRATDVDTTTGETKVLNFVFKSEADGVNEIANDELEMTNIFNLAGQRLQKLQKGVNIVGGKKVLVK